MARLISSARTTLAKTGPGPEDELAPLLVVDGDPADVGGQQVGGELDAGERAVDRSGQRLGEERLAHAGDVLDQHVAAGDQADDDLLGDVPLALDDPFDVGDDRVETLPKPVERVGTDRHGRSSLRLHSRDVQVINESPIGVRGNPHRSGEDALRFLGDVL